MKKFIWAIPVALVCLFLFFNTYQPAISAETANGYDAVFVTGSANMLVHGTQELIDPEDPQVIPIVHGDRAYVPLSLWEKLWGSIENIDELETIEKNGVAFIPLRQAAESAGRSVFYQDGVIIITQAPITPDEPEITTLFNNLSGLPRVGTQEKLNELLGEYAANNLDGVYFAGEMVEESAPAATDREVSYDSDSGSASVTSNEAPAQEKSDDYSTTNIQVEGVDEGDIIKTDGEYIYYSDGYKVSLVKAFPASAMALASSVSFEDGYVKEIYIHQNQMVVLTESYGSGLRPLAKKQSYRPGNTVTTVYIYNTGDKSKLQLEKTVELDGNYTTSRRIGNNLYLLTTISAYQLMEDAVYQLPSYTDSTLDASVSIGYDRLHYFPEAVSSTYTNIAGIQLDNLSEPVYVESYLGYGDNFYVSQNHLYMTTTQYRPLEPGRTSLYNHTNIYQFQLAGGKMHYTNRGRVEGTVLNQFSMDEHNGYFRIATTSQLTNGGSSNNMFVLDGDLDTVGSLRNIAPGEQIYSVRFMGNRGYMVTFKTVDPLFAIDLSVPEKPAILGELKIPGYSNYLHPYDENHLIGFGMDTVEQNGNAYMKGMKVSLFDITDMENPKEKFTTLIGDRGTTSEVLYNHRSLLFSKEKNLIAFPIEVYLIKDSGDKNDVFSYGEMAFQGAYVYGLDLDHGFDLRTQITHTQELYDYNAYIKRILFIGDTLYTVSDQKIMGTSLSTYTETGQVSLDQ